MAIVLAGTPELISITRPPGFIAAATPPSLNRTYSTTALSTQPRMAGSTDRK